VLLNYCLVVIVRVAKLIFILLAIIALLLMCIPVGYFVLNDSENQPIIKNTSTPQGIVAYLINLDRSTERLAFAQPQIAKLNIPLQRIAAVDGSKLSQEEFSRDVDLATYHNFVGQSPKAGIIGCSLSHIKTWETFLASPYEYAIIFEDDISFDPEKVLQAIHNLQQNAQYWDIANLEVYHRGLPVTIKKLDEHTRMVVYLVETTHTGAYIINRHAARQLLHKALPIKMSIDLYFTRTWEFGLKYVGIEPRIIQQTFGDSEIESSKRNNDDFKASVEQTLIKKIYKIQTSVIRFIYNLWNLLCAWQN
jgi:glycosyl transferase family 25